MDQPKQKRLFRFLREDEIEVREGSFVGKDKDRVELLCYKTARTDYALLDETFGAFNWDIQYASINGATYCGIGIKDPITCKFVYKWNAGSVDPDTKDYAKALASDAAKRSGFAWGLGVELYSSPRIVIPRVPGSSYRVSEIKYSEEGKITHLTIVDQNDENVFQMTPEFTCQRSGLPKEPEKDGRPWNVRLKEYCGNLKNETDDPDVQTKLLAFYYENVQKTERGEKYGCTKLWQWFLKDLKEGKIEIDATNPRHPTVRRVK